MVVTCYWTREFSWYVIPLAKQGGLLSSWMKSGRRNSCGRHASRLAGTPATYPEEKEDDAILSFHLSASWTGPDGTTSCWSTSAPWRIINHKLTIFWDNVMCSVQRGSHEEESLRTHIDSNTSTDMSAEGWQETEVRRSPIRHENVGGFGQKLVFSVNNYAIQKNI